MGFPHTAVGGKAVSGLVDKAKNAVDGVINKAAGKVKNMSGELENDVLCGETAGKIYELEVISPHKLEKNGFQDLKRGDVIYLQILDYDEAIFQICNERRLQCATFSLDERGRMVRVDTPVLK
jgi:hypothetical protein